MEVSPLNDSGILYEHNRNNFVFNWYTSPWIDSVGRKKAKVQQPLDVDKEKREVE